MTAPYLDPDAFDEARLNGLAGLRQRQGIGTLGERSLHAVMKYWLDPDDSHHEIRLERCVADIFDGQQVTEIQTRGFSALRPKLERLLETYPVTVVHPLTWHKTLVWVDPASGETSKPRRSPKTRPLLGRRSRTCLYSRPPGSPPPDGGAASPRYGGIPADRRLERRRQEGIPPGRADAHRPGSRGRPAREGGLRQPAAPDLPEPFTTADVKRASRLSQKGTGTLVNILYNLGVIQRTGKKGNAFLYQKAP